MAEKGHALESQSYDAIRVTRHSNDEDSHNIRVSTIDTDDEDTESGPESLHEVQVFSEERVPLLGQPRLLRTVPRRDSLDVESTEVAGAENHHHGESKRSLWMTLGLAFQTIGIVYGDMGTSPLYVYSSAFSQLEIGGRLDILGALSIIIYTLTLIPLVKYVLIVLHANNNGEGGTLSLYALICRYAKVNLLPNRQTADERLSHFRIKALSKRLERAVGIKSALEKSFRWKNALAILILLGTSLVMGDGILTPCISVLSAVSGLTVVLPNMNQDVIVVASILILIFLFSLQRFGTSKVGFLFAPILSVWFAAIATLGLHNILTYDTGVFEAFNPAYIIIFFRRNGFQAWYALGGLVLCITGGEAMFADLGHFSVRSIQIAFSFVVYPCLLLAYMGQAAYLIRFPSAVGNAFYNSIPDAVFWPMLVISTLAATIASQAMISATFSVIKMAMAIDAFPRVKIIHTSSRFMGQIYIPVINWFLMIMCIIIIVAFQNTVQLGNAYGVAVVGDMVVTTSFVTLIMLMIWHTPLLLVLLFLLVIGLTELIYLSAVLLKVTEGAWVPLVLATCILTVMYIWHYGNRMKYQSEVERKIPMDYMLKLGPQLGTIRVRGFGLLYNELVDGVPAIFAHFLKSLPAMHSTVVFVCIKYVPVPKVPQSERFLFRRVCPRDFHLFRCVARYGYKDLRKEDHHIFQQLLLQKLEQFLIQEAHEYALEHDELSERSDGSVSEAKSGGYGGKAREEAMLKVNEDAGGENGGAFEHADALAAAEIAHVKEASEGGIVYFLGHGEIRAKKESWFVKKLVINYAYAFMARNCRATTEALSVPHTNLLEVGMTHMV